MPFPCRHRFRSPCPGGINIDWFGHGFVYITSSFGVRAAIDPFGPNTVHYPFPPHLTADFVLITHEAEDHASLEDKRAGR